MVNYQDAKFLKLLNATHEELRNFDNASVNNENTSKKGLSSAHSYTIVHHQAIDLKRWIAILLNTLYRFLRARQ